MELVWLLLDQDRVNFYQSLVKFVSEYFGHSFSAAEVILEASMKTRQLQLDDVFISGILRRKTKTRLYHKKAVYERYKNRYEW